MFPRSTESFATMRVGYGDYLISRAAYEHLKERRKVVCVVRQTSLAGSIWNI